MIWKTCQNAARNQTSVGDDFWSLLLPLGWLWLHLGCHLNPNRVQRGTQNAPGAPQDELKGSLEEKSTAKRHPKGAKSELKAPESSQREPKGAKRVPKGSQKAIIGRHFGHGWVAKVSKHDIQNMASETILSF